MKNLGANTALVGLGYWGKNILRNLHELGALHTACDCSEETIAVRQNQYPGVNFVRNFEDILADPGIKAVAIATPAVSHYEKARLALLAGKDVFVEKPLALNTEDGEHLVKIAEEHGRVLMVGHILHYHPAVLGLKELVASGRLGRIQYVYSNRLNIGQLRVEENILWSFAPHDISVILKLLEEEPLQVSAFGGDYLNRGICDTTLTTLEFRNGVKGHIFVSWLHPYKEQKLIVVGSKAMALFDDMSVEKLFLYPHSIEWKDGKIPVARKADYEVIPVETREPLKEELRHFLECVSERKQPVTDGREGLKVLKVLRRAEQALVGSGVPSTGTEIPPAMIHESACVDEGAGIGEGTRVWHFSHILKGSVIGRNCVLGQNVAIGPDVTIGNGCKIQNNVSIYKGVTLEDEVFCGPSCVFTNVYNPRAFIERKQEFRKTHVGRGATLGANATLVCGVTIGKYAMVGAGAVVKSDVPDYAVVAGVPSRQTGWICRCGVSLVFDNGLAACGSCGLRYVLSDDGRTVREADNA